MLYDWNKITLSCATISSTFEVTLKENVYFSYHDNQQKYWSLYASEPEMKQIIDLFKSFNAVVKFSLEEDKETPQIRNVDTASEINKKAGKEEKESDTDSSVNRRTKMSILNRMANMGQSVLPPRALSTERTSDSSDTNEASHYKTVRHKPVKSVIKRNSSDKNLPECQSLVESGHQNVEHSTNSVPLFTYVNGQLVPVTNSNIITCNSSGNDMSLYISEQRVSNSEIRINMTRLTDKVDHILGKLSVIEDKDNNSPKNNFQMEVLQKLLAEYENKIKLYEEYIKAKDLNKSPSPSFVGVFPKEDAPKVEEDFTKRVKSLEQLNKDKDDKIAQLEVECKLLHEKCNTKVYEEKKSKEELTAEIEKLKQELKTKNEELINSTRKAGELSQRSEVDGHIGDKIKNIMNDTFRSVSANFENNELYSGEKVKVITASIIKKVTIEALNEL